MGLDLAPLIIRIGLAAIFIYHGYSTIFEPNHESIKSIEKQMTEKGALHPDVLAWAAAFTEFGGGILILAGVFSRIWGLAMAILMGVAIWVVHVPISGLTLDNESLSFCLVLGLMALAIFLGGPGAISLDHKLFGRKINTYARESSGDELQPLI